MSFQTPNCLIFLTEPLNRILTHASMKQIKTQGPKAAGVRQELALAFTHKVVRQLGLSLDQILCSPCPPIQEPTSQRPNTSASNGRFSYHSTDWNACKNRTNEDIKISAVSGLIHFHDTDKHPLEAIEGL